MLLTPRFIDAMDFAREAHGSQVRKGTQVPYLSHPMAVASLVLEYGGGEDEAIAGLLHDVLEDEGEHLAGDIESRFGEYVLKLVVECSDAIIGEGRGEAALGRTEAGLPGGDSAQDAGRPAGDGLRQAAQPDGDRAGLAPGGR